MKLFFRLLCCTAAVVSLLLLADGCGRRTPVAARPPPPEETAAAEKHLLSNLNQILAQANDALVEGRTNAAIASVENACSNRAFAAYRPQILDTLIQMLLRIGRPDDARRRAFAARTDAVLSVGACGQIYRYYRETGDRTNALAWSAALALPETQPDIRRQAFTWNMEDHIALGEDAQALAMLNKAFQTLTPSESMSLARSTIEALFGARRLESVEKVLALATNLKNSAVERKHLTIATQVRISAVRGDWATLTNDFPVAVRILNDGELDGLLRAVISAAGKAGRRAVIDQCAEALLFNPTASSNHTAVATAARVWGANAMETDKGAFPNRLETMLRANVPAAPIITLFFRYFYSFTEEPVPLKNLIALGERLTPLAADEETRNELKVKVLDGCFLVRDYDRALSLLEAHPPGPGRSEQWHATAIVKVKAHRALQRNEPREAVKYFRAFMDLLRASKEADISDPISGLLLPKEMVLGRNAKRIGDILAGIPDPAESAKAYAEARELYAQALKNTRNSAAIAAIKAERAQVPVSQ